MGLLRYIGALFAALDRRPVPPIASHNELGRYGEAIAWAALKRRGYKLLARNYRVAQGEIDLICREGKVLVFVEVKTRRSTRYGTPGEAVGAGKQRRMTLGAQSYLQAAGNPQVLARFDVVEVELTEGKVPEIRIIENAFSAR